MRLITPFDIKRLFPKARSAAVVGNASTLLQYESGKKIDSHNLVIRFNDARVQGWERHTGKRTDILFTHLYHSRSKSPPPRQSLNPKCVVCFMSRKDYDAPIEEFSEWVEDIPTFFSFTPDILPTAYLRQKQNFLTGTYALYMLIHCFSLESLFLTGFTHFRQSTEISHYWNSSDIPPAEHFHDLDRERQALASILSEFKGQLSLTSDVASLLKDESIAKSASLKQRLSGRLGWILLELGMKLRRWT